MVLRAPHYTGTAPLEYKLKMNDTTFVGIKFDYAYEINGIVVGKWDAYV